MDKGSYLGAEIVEVSQWLVLPSKPDLYASGMSNKMIIMYSKSTDVCARRDSEATVFSSILRTLMYF